MKKALISVFLAITLFLACMPSSFADQPHIQPVFVDGDDAAQYYHTAYYANQDCYGSVKLVYNQFDSKKEEYIRPVLFTLQYQYHITKDHEGNYVGGYCEAFIPEVISTHPLYHVSVENLSPTRFHSVVGGLSFYELTIAGGMLSITYDAEIHFDENGNITKTVPTTETRSYYFVGTNR